jgi:hypothetical protein
VWRDREDDGIEARAPLLRWLFMGKPSRPLKRLDAFKCAFPSRPIRKDLRKYLPGERNIRA